MFRTNTSKHSSVKRDLLELMQAGDILSCNEDYERFLEKYIVNDQTINGCLSEMQKIMARKNDPGFWLELRNSVPILMLIVLFSQHWMPREVNQKKVGLSKFKENAHKLANPDVLNSILILLNDLIDLCPLKQAGKLISLPVDEDWTTLLDDAQGLEKTIWKMKIWVASIQELQALLFFFYEAIKIDGGIIESLFQDSSYRDILINILQITKTIKKSNLTMEGLQQDIESFKNNPTKSDLFVYFSQPEGGAVKLSRDVIQLTSNYIFKIHDSLSNLQMISEESQQVKRVDASEFEADNINENEHKKNEKKHTKKKKKKKKKQGSQALKNEAPPRSIKEIEHEKKESTPEECNIVSPLEFYPEKDFPLSKQLRELLIQQQLAGETEESKEENKSAYLLLKRTLSWKTLKKTLSELIAEGKIKFNSAIFSLIIYKASLFGECKQANSFFRLAQDAKLTDLRVDLAILVSQENKILYQQVKKHYESNLSACPNIVDDSWMMIAAIKNEDTDVSFIENIFDRIIQYSSKVSINELGYLIEALSCLIDFDPKNKNTILKIIENIYNQAKANVDYPDDVFSLIDAYGRILVIINRNFPSSSYPFAATIYNEMLSHQSSLDDNIDFQEMIGIVNKKLESLLKRRPSLEYTQKDYAFNDQTKMREAIEIYERSPLLDRLAISGEGAQKKYTIDLHEHGYASAYVCLERVHQKYKDEMLTVDIIIGRGLHSDKAYDPGQHPVAKSAKQFLQDKKLQYKVSDNPGILTCQYRKSPVSCNGHRFLSKRKLDAGDSNFSESINAKQKKDHPGFHIS